MSTAAPEAPPASTVMPSTTVMTATPPDPVFKDIFNTPENAPAKDISKAKPPEKKPEAKETPAKRTETPPDASGKAKGTKVAPEDPDAQKAPKSRLDSIEAIKKPDAVDKAEPDIQSTDEDSPPEGKDAQSRWMQLKAAEKKLQELEPLHQKLQKDFEDFKVKGFIPEDTGKELERLRHRYAVEEVTNSPEYQREVSMPIQQSFRNIGEVAQAMGLDETAGQALLNAVRNTNGVQRRDSIWDIVSSIRVKEKDADGEVQEVPLPDHKITSYATAISSEADELHKKHWPKEVEYMRQAQEIAKSSHEKDVELTAAERVQKEESMGKEATRQTLLLKDRMPLVFEEHPELEAELMKARPSTSLEDQVFDSLGANALTFLAKSFNTLLKENAELKKTSAARNGAKPKLSGDVVKDPPKKDDSKISWNEAFGGPQR